MGVPLAVAILLITLAIMLIVITIEPAGERIDKRDWTYEEIIINGRPCIIVGRAIGGKQWSYEGISCDWSN